MFDFLKSGSAKIQAEIEAESQRAQEAVTTEARLKEARSDALLAADPKELDRIDAQLVISSRDAGRRAERVQLLQQKLEQAKAREDEQKLDAIVARAEKARKLGEDLIRKDYAKQAAALADTLLKLRAIDTCIDDLNRALSQAGRESTVPSPNGIRQTPAREEVRTVRRTVGISDPQHPDHAEYVASSTTEHYSGGHQSTTIMLPSGKSVPRFAEVDYKENVWHAPAFAVPLYTEIKVVPSATSDQTPLYHAGNEHGEKLAKLIKELDL